MAQKISVTDTGEGFSLILIKDGSHRRVVKPNSSLSGESADVVSLANQLFTDDAIAAYGTSVSAQIGD